MVTIAGCRSRAAAWASRKVRRRAVARVSSSGPTGSSTSLTATSRSSSSSRARQTVPMPPVPSGSSNRYRPASRAPLPTASWLIVRRLTHPETVRRHCEHQVVIRIVQLPPAAVAALADGDLATANRHSPVPLSVELAGPAHRGLWRYRSRQLAEHPGDEPWITGVICDGEQVVGRAGFHGAPDSDGMVEVGYAVDP